MANFSTSRFTTLAAKLRHAATSTVTPLGWTTLGVALLCLICYPFLGWTELLMAGLIIIVMVACGLAMTIGNTGLKADLKLSAARVGAGATVHVDVRISNPGAKPTSALWAALPIGDLGKQFTLRPLAPGASKHTDIDFQAVRRAVLHVGPLSVRRGDPFGLVRRERRLTEMKTVYIHPKTVHLPSLEAGNLRDLEGSASEQIVDDDLDFHGLREYQPGDDIRHIHWLSSVKSGRMMVRQYDATKLTDTSISLTTDPSAYADAAEFELAISALASLGVQCLEQHHPLAIHTENKQRNPGSALDLLDWCSTITPIHETHIALVEPTLASDPSASFYFFVTGSQTVEESIRRMDSALPGTSSRIFIRAQNGAERSISQSGDCTLATIGTLNDLQLIMEALA